MKASDVADHFPDVQAVTLGDLDFSVNGQGEPKFGVADSNRCLATDLSLG